MNKKVLYLIIGLICISLLGIISVQFFWIRNAIHVKEAQFDRSVFDAMGTVVNKLETRENVYFIGKNYVSDSVRDLFRKLSNDSTVNFDPNLDSLLAADKPDTFSHLRTRRPKVFTYNFTYDFPQLQNLATFDSMTGLHFYPDLIDQAYFNAEKIFEINENELKRLDSIFYQQQTIINENHIDYQIEQSSNGNSEMIVHYSVNPNHAPPPPSFVTDKTRNVIKDHVKKLNRKALKVKDVIKKMTIEMESKPRPIEERISKKGLEQILGKVFEDKDIDQKFEFAVTKPENNQQLTLIRSDGFKPEFLSTKYKITLFPNDIFQKQHLLLVQFPRSGNSVLTSLSWLMIVSILFTLIIAISSGLSVFVMIRQKKISDIKTDFINNMTHEFKTPIATISVAVDSINNPKVIERPDVIKNYTRVIKEENNRMNTRVEQVLQMALLDSSEFKLNEKPVDVHEMIRNITDNIRLQTESRNGQLIVNLEAGQTKVLADESHMTNVLISILDNAIKYSPVNPEIRVSTTNSRSSIVISISDNGIGMNSDTQKKIFDKFFRVTSGNIHSIKGFGLGLSYAKAIVLAHKGEIKVNSEVDKGSRFEIILPVISVS